jgi:hypothetical protein
MYAKEHVRIENTIFSYNSQSLIFEHLSSPLLSPILPARAVDTPLRLVTNILPAILAFDLFLHNIVICRPRVCHGNAPQRQRN